MQCHGFTCDDNACVRFYVYNRNQPQDHLTNVLGDMLELSDDRHIFSSKCSYEVLALAPLDRVSASELLFGITLIQCADGHWLKPLRTQQTHFVF